MSAGRAVLALPRSGAAGVVLHGQTGLRLHSCDPATVAEGIRRAIGDPRLLQRMGRAGHARWESEHSPTVRALRLADIYDQVAASAS
jgi:glycosyltransferase involved in cell wall biosynthesis